jgi:exopolysaccharide biosynthesis polyprenyl glycosylphosphotransferase
MMVVTFPVFVGAAVLAWRLLYALTLPQPSLRQRAIIVGAGSAGQLIARTLAEEAAGEYQLVGFVDGALSPGMTIALHEGAEKSAGVQDRPASNGLPVIGAYEYLTQIVGRYRATTLVLSLAQEVDSDLLQALMACSEQGVEVVPMSLLYEQLTGRVPVEHVHSHWHVALPVHHLGHSPLWRATKRIMDVLLAGAGLAFLALILPAIAVAITIDSPGPVFYTQRRVGKGGRLFNIYKFRTMQVGAENGHPIWAREGDSRTTRMGRVLRATHLDELPQVLNVLRGEMSAVGPRPERPEFVDMLVEALPFYPLRHTVKPGMAGWALVKQGYAGTREDALVKLQYDLFYIKHQSLWLDILILLKTFEHALALQGR